MKPTTLQDLAFLLNGQLNGDPAAVAMDFATDSRSVKPGDVFLAIKGARVDGHEFIPAALRAGAVAAVVERPVDGPHILVTNLVGSLAHMAATFRNAFHGPVVGITGSAGKTTTKEFVAGALSPLGPVLKNKGNRNTEYTSPLLWTDLAEGHRAVVVEMAMRGFGQIAHLAAFTRPTIGVVTNVGFAHLEMVGSRKGIADAKGELLESLPANGTAILWREDEYFESLRSKSKAPVKTFGYAEGADCRIERYQPLDWESCLITGQVDGHAWESRLPTLGRHVGLSAAAAILTAVCAGVDPQAAAGALAGVKLPPMRMEVVDFQGAKILLDTYNASPPSMVAALETLSELPVAGRRLAVIGEMRELGEHTESGHREVGRALAESKVDEVVLFGAPVGFVREEALSAGYAPDRIHVAESIGDVRNFLRQAGAGDAVLIKGSRALELERALEAST